MVILVAQCFIQPSQSSGAVTSSLSLCSLRRLLYVSFGKLICVGIYLVCHCFVFTGDAKVVMCGVGSFAEQVINVPTKHSVPLLNSHELPCLRLYSYSRFKVIISQAFKVATAVAVWRIIKGNEVEMRRCSWRNRCRRRNEGHQGQSIIKE